RLDAQGVGGYCGDRSAQVERERGSAAGREQQVLAALQPRIRVDPLAAVGVQLEVEMCRAPVRVAGVADVAEHLAGGNLRAVLQTLRVRGPSQALALVVALPRRVVVGLDGVVGYG